MKRSDCIHGPRPCIKISCKHHMIHGFSLSWALYTDEQIVDMIFDMPETCTLDVADRGKQPLRVIGECLGISHQRVDQLLSGHPKPQGIGIMKKFVRRIVKVNRKIYLDTP